MTMFDGLGAVRGPSWPLVRALQPLPCLAELNSRNFIVRLLVDELGPLPIDESTLAVQHLFSIVDVCRRQPDGLTTLLDVVSRFDRDTKYLPEVERIVTEMTVPDVWPRAERDHLLTLLSGMSFSDVDLYRQVAGSAAPELPAQATYREALLALDTLNATAAGLPKTLVFVEHLAHRVQPELAVELRRWGDRQAVTLGLITELQALRRGAQPRLPDPSPNAPAYLVFLLRYEGGSGERYRLSHWRQRDLTDGWHPDRGDDVVGSLDQVKRCIALLIEAVEADWARYQPDIRIEVVLSSELLNLDVDQWPWESDSPLPVPIGCRYALVVRSLDRMQRKQWHRAWHSRWGTLHRQVNSKGALAPSSCRRAESSADPALRVLAANFENDSELVALVLSAPPHPAAAGRDEVTVGLRAGVPIIVWHRQDCGSEVFLSTVHELLHSTGQQTILQHLRQLRANAFAAESPHVGTHLILLWDDPERIVVPSDAGPPKGESAA